LKSRITIIIDFKNCHFYYHCGSALESIARQPEATGDIRANMILTAALVEGAAFFAMVVGLLVVFKS